MDILSETLHLRTEMQTLQDKPEVYIPPRGILANAILNGLPLEVRYNIYSYLWSTDTAAKVDYMALLDTSSENSWKKRCPIIPNFVDRGTVGFEFAEEAVKWLYESDQLGIMIMSLQWNEVPKFFRTDVIKLGVAPEDVKIQRLCVELDISGVTEFKMLSRQFHNNLEPLFKTEVKRNGHLELRIAQKVQGSRRDRDERVMLTLGWRFKHKLAEAVRRLEKVGFAIDMTYAILRQRQDGSHYRPATMPFDVTLLHEDATLEQWQKSVTAGLQEGSGFTIGRLRLW